MGRLYRSRKDAKLFGVCGGLAEMMNVDPTLVRIVVVVATFFSGGTVIPIYIIASLVIPKEPLFTDSNLGGGFGGHSGNPGNYQHGQGHFHTNMGGFSNNAGQPGAYPPPPPPPQYKYNDPYSAGPMNSNKQSSSNLDDMMKDIEKKAMQKELEELRARLAKLENQNKDSKGDE